VRLGQAIPYSERQITPPADAAAAGGAAPVATGGTGEGTAAISTGEISAATGGEAPAAVSTGDAATTSASNAGPIGFAAAPANACNSGAGTGAGATTSPRTGPPCGTPSPNQPGAPTDTPTRVSLSRSTGSSAKPPLAPQPGTADRRGAPMLSPPTSHAASESGAAVMAGAQAGSGRPMSGSQMAPAAPSDTQKVSYPCTTWRRAVANADSNSTDSPPTTCGRPLFSLP